MKLKSILAGATTLAILFSTQSALAWHPVGVISKQVQNVTTNGSSREANTDNEAVEVKTGDIVRYTIRVTNNGSANSQGYNDLAYIEVYDEIPAGLELIANPSERRISYEVDILAPGESDVKTFDMKVTSVVNRQIVINNACFNGDSTVNDRPQSGCDQARIRLNIPQTSSTTTTTPTPTPVVKAAVTMPKTGVSNVFTIGMTSGILAYAISLLVQKRRYTTN